MNYMAQTRKTKRGRPSKGIIPSRTARDPLRLLAENIGDFIRYWGFRRIHGEIWSIVYLSKRPLSGTELVRKLHVSKALISPALAELLEYQLIQVAGGDGKTKTYCANPEVFAAIRKVLKEREAIMLKKVASNFETLQNLPKEKTASLELDRERLETLGKMIAGAQVVLEFIMNTANDHDFHQWSELS